MTTSWATQTLNLQDSLEARHNEQGRSEADAAYPMPITIRFNPSTNRSYSCRFRFKCEFGNGFDLLLQGRGTFEEHEHKPLNPIPK